MDFPFDYIRVLSQVLTLAIVLRAILSWFSAAPTHALTVILFRVTEPLLAPLRHIFPRSAMLDFTPMIAIILLQLIVNLLPRG